MCETNQNLNICLKIDETTIYQFDETINEQSIIDSVRNIEELLESNGATPKKTQDIFELIVEIMQNMLNYSYGNKDLSNNKKEAKGSLVLSYLTDTDTYTIQSCNLVEVQQETIIRQKLNSLEGLNDKELRKLSRQKMRDKTDMHQKGAGLGFIMISRKAIKPIEIFFDDIDDNVKQFKLKLEI